MKKSLLFFLIFAGTLSASAQTTNLWFNEIYPDPASGDNEFIEFYNTSATAVPLDCYVAVSYFNISKSGNTPAQTGVYVYNFPANATLPGLSYYTIASGNPINFSKQTYSFTDPTTFSNWNSPGSGGYLMKYVFTSGSGWDNGTQIGGTGNNYFNDFMNTSNGNAASLLIYRINSDGTTTLVNGLFGNTSSTIPSGLTGFPNLSIPPSSTCATPAISVSLQFNNNYITVNNVEVSSVISATGSGNGYGKNGSGVCGNWVKETSTITPNAANPLDQKSVTSLLTTQEFQVCNNQIKFSVTAPTGSSSLFPVTVLVFYDNGTTTGALDPADTPLPQLTTTVNSASSTWYTLTIPDPSQPVLLIYQTAQGCFSKTVALTKTATGTLTTTQKNVCGQRIDFTVSGTSNSSPAYVLPVTVQLYQDNGIVGTYEPGTDVAIGTHITINSFFTATQSYPIPSQYQGQPVIMVYSSATSCYTTTAVPTALSGTLTTTQTAYCGKRVNYQVTGATGDYSTYALPITVELHYDLNNNKALDANELTVQASQLVTTFSNKTYTMLVPDTTQRNLILVYNNSILTCISKTAVPSVGTESFLSAGNLGGSISCIADANKQRTASYFIVNSSNPNPSAFPVWLRLYEDLNKSATINSGEPIIGNQTITTAPASTAPNTVNTAKLTNYNSAAILVASSTTGCSVASILIDNSCIPLPVHFATFSATRNKATVSLKWQTTTEQNNKGFNVQRNLNGEWKNIALVFSQAEGGNSASTLTYEYKDMNDIKGVSQYRIQQVDMDGRVSYSDVRLVRGEEQGSSVIVYPNPSADGKINVVFDSESVRDITVSDVSGRIIKQYRGLTNSDLVIEKLTGGFYSIKVTDHNSGTTTVNKVIIK